MTPQDAYQEINDIMTQANALVAKARKLADENDVEFECSLYHEVADPDDKWESSDEWDDSGC